VSKTFLVVDDEPDLRELARMSLELVGGYSVVLAGSGEEALAAVERERPDAVVMDVQMPGLDGPSTLRAMHDSGVPVPPTVFLTASVLAHEVAALLELPVQGVLGKPFDPMTLAGQLEQLLGWDA
jgi:CheY-like chemotaxis protein